MADYIESVLGPPPPRPSQEDKQAALNGTATSEQRERLRAWREYWASGYTAVEEAFKGGASLEDLGYQNVQGKGKHMWDLYGPGGLHSAYGGAVEGKWQYDWLRGRKRKQDMPGLEQTGWVDISPEEKAGYQQWSRWQGRHPGASYRDFMGWQGLRRGSRGGNGWGKHFIKGPDGNYYAMWDPATGQPLPGSPVWDQYFRPLTPGTPGFKGAGSWQANLPPLLPQGAGGPPGGGTQAPNIPNKPPIPAPPGGGNPLVDTKAVLWPDFTGGMEKGMAPLTGQVNPSLEVPRLGANMGSTLFPAQLPTGTGIPFASGYDASNMWANYMSGGSGFGDKSSSPMSGNRFDAFSAYSNMFPSQQGQGSNLWGDWGKWYKKSFGDAWNTNLWGGSR